MDQKFILPFNYQASMKFFSAQHYIFFITQSYARGWEVAIRHYEAQEAEKKAGKKKRSAFVLSH